MACDICGHTWAMSSRDCKICNPHLHQSAAPNHMNPEQARAMGKVGESFGRWLVTAFPYLVFLFALIYGGYRFMLAIDATDYPILAMIFIVAWLAALVSIVVFRKQVGGAIGWLASIAFVLWFIGSPPSADIASAQAEYRLEQDVEAFWQAVEKVESCRRSERVAQNMQQELMNNEDKAACVAAEAQIEKSLARGGERFVQGVCAARGEWLRRSIVSDPYEPPEIVEACK